MLETYEAFKKEVHELTNFDETIANLKKEIESNNFREDLYHRLSVILIHVPTLNEREDDIPLLAEHFNTLICKEYGMGKKIIKKDAIRELQKIEWTGNIRELCRRVIRYKKDVVKTAGYVFIFRFFNKFPESERKPGKYHNRIIRR